MGVRGWGGGRLLRPSSPVVRAVGSRLRGNDGGRGCWLAGAELLCGLGRGFPACGDFCKTFVAPAKAGIQGERTSSGSSGCSLSPPHPNPLPRGERGFLIQALKGEGVMQRSPYAGMTGERGCLAEAELFCSPGRGFLPAETFA